MKDNFNINRMWLFIKRHLLLNQHSLSISAATVLGILVVITFMIFNFFPMNIKDIISTYNVLFFIFGFIFTSRIFAELNTQQKSYAYLTLPVSTKEKLIGSWLISSVFFVIAFKLCTIIIYVAACLVTKNTEAISLAFSIKELQQVFGFITQQSMFFLGAIYFRNSNFQKTLGTLIIIVLFAMLYCVLLWAIMFRAHEVAVGFNVLNFKQNTGGIISYFISVLLAFYLIVISYFKLKERQA